MLRRQVRLLSALLIIGVVVFAGLVAYSIFVPLDILGSEFDELVFTDALMPIAIAVASTLSIGVVLRFLTGAYFYEYGSGLRQDILDGVYGFFASFIIGSVAFGIFLLTR